MKTPHQQSIHPRREPINPIICAYLDGLNALSYGGSESAARMVARLRRCATCCRRCEGIHRCDGVPDLSDSD